MSKAIVLGNCARFRCVSNSWAFCRKIGDNFLYAWCLCAWCHRLDCVKSICNSGNIFLRDRGTILVWQRQKGSTRFLGILFILDSDSCQIF